MSFKLKLVAAFGAALLILAALGVLSYRRTLREDQDQKWVLHTHQVIETLDAVKADLAGGKTDQRDYLILRQDSSLDAARSAGQRVRENVAALRRLTTDNAKQQHSLDVLEPLITTQVEEFERNNIDSGSLPKSDTKSNAKSIAKPIAKPIDGSARASASLAATLMSVGKYMDRIQQLLSEMASEEQKLMAQRIEAANASSRDMKVVLILGNILGLVFLFSAALVVHHELENRRRADEVLRASEERFRLMVSNVQDYAILMLDPQGHVISWNEGAERIKGYRAEEIIGQHFSRFYPAEDLERGKPAYELKTAAEVGKFEDEGWRVRKDGSRFWANVIITALRDEKGRLRGFAKVSRDLTERMRNEERMRIHNAHLEASNKELEAFCYSVSHDLRAPLRGIDGFSQALLEDHANQLDTQGKEYLQRVRASAQRMATLIDDLLNLSRITRNEMHRETVDLSSMADSIALDLHNREPQRKVSFVISSGLQAEADPRLLRIALENLLANSWKFTSLRDDAQIEMGWTQNNGKSAYFVRDNGVGFDTAHASKLFGPFQRLHAMNEFPGTGIGLATVQRIIQRHGGRIWAEAALDRGATFYFTL
jgi:PAS domain S-box-containing protein